MAAENGFTLMTRLEQASRTIAAAESFSSFIRLSGLHSKFQIAAVSSSSDFAVCGVLVRERKSRRETFQKSDHATTQRGTCAESLNDI